MSKKSIRSLCLVPAPKKLTEKKARQWLEALLPGLTEIVREGFADYGEQDQRSERLFAFWELSADLTAMLQACNEALSGYDVRFEKSQAITNDNEAARLLALILKQHANSSRMVSSLDDSPIWEAVRVLENQLLRCIDNSASNAAKDFKRALDTTSSEVLDELRLAHDALERLANRCEDASGEAESVLVALERRLRCDQRGSADASVEGLA